MVSLHEMDVNLTGVNEFSTIIKFTNHCEPAPPTGAFVSFYFYFALVLSFVNFLINSLALWIYQDIVWVQNPLILLLKCFSTLESLFNFFVFLHMLGEISVASSFVLPGRPDLSLWLERGQRMVDCLLVGTQLTRNWLVVALAYSRYRIICQPIIMTNTRSSRHHVTSFWFLNRRRTYFFVCVLAIFLVALAIPRIYETVNYICIYNGEIARSEALLYKNKIYIVVYRAVLLFSIQSGGPVTLVIILSIMIILHLRRNRSQLLGNASSGGEERRHAATRLIMILCVTFAVLEMPSFFIKLLPTRDEDVEVQLTANLCVYLDSSANFLIYLLSNETFRVCLMRKCGRIWHAVRGSGGSGDGGGNADDAESQEEDSLEMPGDDSLPPPSPYPATPLIQCVERQTEL